MGEVGLPSQFARSNFDHTAAVMHCHPCMTEQNALVSAARSARSALHTLADDWNGMHSQGGLRDMRSDKPNADLS